MLDVFKSKLIEMHMVLGNYAFFYLNQILTMPERTELYNDFEKVFDKTFNMENCTYLRFAKFFKNQAKLSEFKKFYIDANTNIKEFKVQALAGSYHRAEEVIKNAPKEYWTKTLFSEGIDVYKGKLDSINGIAINYCEPEFMALATEKGSREINIKDSLMYRNRTVDGLKLLDEEVDEWAAGLKRFNKKIEEFNDTLNPSYVVACIGKLFSKPKSNVTGFTDFDPVSLLEWNQKNSEEYYFVFLIQYMKFIKGKYKGTKNT